MDMETPRCVFKTHTSTSNFFKEQVKEVNSLAEVGALRKSQVKELYTECAQASGHTEARNQLTEEILCSCFSIEEKFTGFVSLENKGQFHEGSMVR